MFMITGSLFKNQENMVKLHSETTQGLSGYACYGKNKSHYVVCHAEKIGNALNTLEKLQIFFLWSPLKKMGKRAFKNTFGLNDYAY